MSRLFDLTTTPIEDGITVIEASAGSGKTYCLTGLVLRLLLERRVSDVSELLVVTFTNAATQELVERLRAALAATCRLLAGEGAGDTASDPPRDDPFLRHLAETCRGDGEALRIAREALVRFDELTVSTIHGFCLRVLGDSAFESGEPFGGELVEDAAPLLREAARDVWRRLLYVPSAPRLVASVVTEEGLTPESFLPDWQLWRRHPRTEILPPALDLAPAMRRLSAAGASLRDAWDLDAVRALLEPRRFKLGAYFAGALADRLRDTDAFCRHGEPSGLRPVRELAAEKLEASLFKRDRAGVAAHPVIAACGAFAAAVDSFLHALRREFITEVDRRFEAEKRQALTWTYDDLLGRLRDALDHPRYGSALARAVRRRYRAALIDEFQDTDLVQYKIFRRLFRRGPMVLIGDPKQAIYRFRGADVFAYLAARDDADRVFTLEHNWRTERPLVEAVNTIFGRHGRSAGRPFVFEQIAFEPAVAARRAGPAGGDRGYRGDRGRDAGTTISRRPLQWIWVPRLRTRELARAAIEDATTGEIMRLLGGERPSPNSGASERPPLAPDDIAVLVRTNEQAMSLQSALRAAGVPSVIGRSGDIFLTEEMADLEILLTAIADPGDAPRLRAAWATRLWGAGERDIRAVNRDDEAFARHLELFAAYRRDWHRRGFMPMIQGLFAERGVRRRLLASVAGQRRLTNLIQAAEVLHSAERERHLSPAALLGWLAGELAGERRSSEDTELRLESDGAAVQIATVHRSKGLEYEIVFCPYLWQARATDRTPVQAHGEGSRLVLDYGSETLDRHRRRAEAERLSEEARLAYVALTRARRRCYVVWGDVPGKDGPAASALGYLLHRGAAAAGNTPAMKPEELAERAAGEVKARRQRWRRDLERLIAAHAGTMELRSVEEMASSPVARSTAPLEAPGGPGGPDAESGPAALDPRPRRFRGSVPEAWRLESFSSLSRAGYRGRAEDVSSAPLHGDPGRQDLEDHQPAIPAGPPPAGAGMLAFARGRRAGTCLHRVLERCDLARLDDDDTDRQIAEALRRYRLEEPRRHHPAAGAPGAFNAAGAVRDLLRRLATATLPGADFALGTVPRERWLVEWKFTMPLARVDPRRLAEVFRDHGRGAVGDEYPARLETLDRGAAHGYLNGFVDLIFNRGERWYLIDWKSNYLGPDAAAYRGDSVWQAMSHHHYVLQYHLYLLALHRFLRQRLAGYDYRRHVAGASYIFLRGVSLRRPDQHRAGEPTGWYLDRPPLALIEALDELIGGRA